jgi:single-strand DNA-binding protein
MPSFETEGTIEKIYELRVVSEKFQLREFVLKVPDGNYHQELMMQFTNMDCDKLDGFKEGDEVKVSCWVKGKKWQRSPQDEPKWFNSLQARTIVALHANHTDQSAEFNQAAAMPEPPPLSDIPDDDLPF